MSVISDEELMRIRKRLERFLPGQFVEEAIDLINKEIKQREE
jgi:hypothetical protein